MPLQITLNWIFKKMPINRVNIRFWYNDAYVAPSSDNIKCDKKQNHKCKHTNRISISLTYLMRSFYFSFLIFLLICLISVVVFNVCFFFFCLVEWTLAFSPRFFLYVCLCGPFFFFLLLIVCEMDNGFYVFPSVIFYFLTILVLAVFASIFFHLTLSLSRYYYIIWLCLILFV